MQELRRLLREGEGEVRRVFAATRGSLVRIVEPSGRCPLCDGPMKVQKTRRRNAKSLELGELRVIEPIYVCAAGCRDVVGKKVTRRSGMLAEQLLPARASGYDLMVWVGRKRFVKHRQRAEIQEAAEKDLGIRLLEGTISDLSRRFVKYLEALHLDHAPELAAALAADGGWPLHVDATGEEGRGMLLVAMAGWRQWVLGGWRISTECEDQILPRLRTVCSLFGQPCACVRDLYLRILSVRRAVDDLYRRADTIDTPVRRALVRLMRALDPVVSLRSFRAVIRRLRERSKLFNRLRNILRIDPDSTAADLQPEELDQVKSALTKFRDILQDERPARGPAEGRRDAIDLVEEHLQRHGDSLWGHIIPLSSKHGGGHRLVARTNNIAEGKFQQLKHGERRRSGRKSLARDLEHMPPSAVLVSNLSCPDYVRLLCGTLDALPKAFARLDARHAVDQRVSQIAKQNDTAPQIASQTASLPKEDLPLVRSDFLNTYILSAARSRAPRVTIPGR